MTPDAKTKLYCLMGDPVDHSLSPSIHNAAFKALKINSLYLACPVKESGLQGALEGMRALSLGGANVTSPYKEAVISFLDLLSPEAQLLRSVNTIINKEGRLIGETTDGEGFYRSLAEACPAYKNGSSVMVVGAGGAARAAAYTLGRYGASRFFIVNRTPEKGEMLTSLLSDLPHVGHCSYIPLRRDLIEGALQECSVIIYALPIDNPEFLAVVSEGKSDCSDKYLFDLRYNPARTQVMTVFEEKGGHAFNGLGMLLWQAALSFELFTGLEAPLEIMRETIAR